MARLNCGSPVLPSPVRRLARRAGRQHDVRFSDQLVNRRRAARARSATPSDTTKRQSPVPRRSTQPVIGDSCSAPIVRLGREGACCFEDLHRSLRIRKRRELAGQIILRTRAPLSAQTRTTCSSASSHRWRQSLRPWRVGPRNDRRRTQPVMSHQSAAVPCACQQRCILDRIRKASDAHRAYLTPA